MSGGNINLKCPKCGEKIIQPTSTLKDDDKIVCPNPNCGLSFDFKELKRKIQESIEKFKRSHSPIKINVKLK